MTHNLEYAFGFYNAKLESKKYKHEKIVDISWRNAKSLFKEKIINIVNSLDVNDNTYFTLSGGLDTTILIDSLENSNVKTSVLVDNTYDWEDNKYSKIAAQYYGTNHILFTDNFSIETALTEMLEYDKNRINCGDLFFYWYLKQLSDITDSVVGGEGVEFLQPAFYSFTNFLNISIGWRTYDINLANSILNEENDKSNIDILDIYKNFRNKKLNLYDAFLNSLNLYDDNIKYGLETDNYLDVFLFARDWHMKGMLLSRIESFSKKFNITYHTPYLDASFIKFNDSIPMEYKWCMGNPKYLMNKAFQDRLPYELLTRKKQGFRPYDNWYLSRKDEFDSLLKKLNLTSTGDYIKDHTLIAYTLSKKIHGE